MAVNLPAQRRRSIALVTSALVTAGALALSGCTPSSGGGSSNGGGGDNTVTVWHYFSDKNQVKVMTDYKELFEGKNDGVTVENVFVPYDQMNSKLISAAGSKS